MTIFAIIAITIITGVLGGIFGAALTLAVLEQRERRHDAERIEARQRADRAFAEILDRYRQAKEN